mgnify:FL=1
MKAIVLVDTSVFLEILDVPVKASRAVQFRMHLRARIMADERLLLPLATILETGNHIAQNGDGRQRRAAAERYVEQVREAVAGRSPFTPTSSLEVAEIVGWLEEFPDSATRGMGIADLSIVHEWRRQCAIHAGRRVLIWSLDEHLSGYDTGER